MRPPNASIVPREMINGLSSRGGKMLTLYEATLIQRIRVDIDLWCSSQLTIGAL